MALRKVVTKEDPILRKKSREIEKFDGKLWMLLDDMAETMYDQDGCGLAAVQVGILRRAVVMDVGEGIIELINPVIISQEGEREAYEGCLSFPGENGMTIRPAVVKVKAQNRNGQWCVYKGEELKARCFCHEIDHLDGVLFIDRLKPSSENETEEKTSDNGEDK